jgi:hypothetical protein
VAEPLTRQVGAIRGAAEPSSRQLVVPAALMSIAFLGTNALAYVFTVLAARVLAPAAFGELAALLGLLLVGTVPAAGLQTAAALRLGATGGGRSPAVLARLHAAAWVTGLVVVATGVLGAAPLSGLLHLTGPALAWLVALLLPSTLISGYQGLLQGSGRLGRLAGVNGAFGLAKLTGGTAGLLVGGTPTFALAGMTLAVVAAAVAGWVGCGRPGVSRGLRAPLTAALRASGPLLGFVVLLNLDLLLARHHLSAADAGEYAVGAIVSKVSFWLPQGVGVVLLPRLADEAHRRQALPAALALVAGVGAALTAATAALSSAALPLIGVGRPRGRRGLGRRRSRGGRRPDALGDRLAVHDSARRDSGDHGRRARRHRPAAAADPGRISRTARAPAALSRAPARAAVFHPLASPAGVPAGAPETVTSTTRVTPTAAPR